LITDKNVFATGGAGFIGSTLVSRLIENNRIVIFDSFQRDSLTGKGLMEHPNLTVVRGDVRDAAALRQAAVGCELAIHLAAIAGVDTVIKSPTTTMNVNYIGTQNFLEAVHAAGTCECAVSFSTSEVFGSYAYRVSESDTMTTGAVGEARWTYAVSKLAGEHLTYSYFKEFGLPTVNVRPFNVYGPGQIGEGAIHVFVNQALRNEDLVIHGEGDQIRSWTYIDDMVDGIMLALESDKAPGESFNIGNPRGTVTINSLAEMIVQLSGSTSSIRHVERKHVDVDLRIPTVAKARELLNFHPKIELKNGLAETIAWYRKRL
jgi:nucleoside-diphosphate-sugar epimerase